MNKFDPKEGQENETKTQAAEENVKKEEQSEGSQDSAGEKGEGDLID